MFSPKKLFQGGMFQNGSSNTQKKLPYVVIMGIFIASCITLTIVNVAIFDILFFSGHLSSFPGGALPSRSIETQTDNYPDLFIFRRSRKTGSTSMAHALFEALGPFGYTTFPETWQELRIAIRNEFRRPKPRRVMHLYHNSITRDDHPTYNAIIADTFRDGFSQVTSHCRHLELVKTCGDEMIECMESNKTKLINIYRYLETEGVENKENYIDLPLSSEYPALSTTVMRTIFPGVVLNIDRYNTRESACNETKELRKVYNAQYKPLQEQNRILKMRMLVVAGYPFQMADKYDIRQSNVTIDDMLLAAELAERKKYEGINVSPEVRLQRGEKFAQITLTQKKWYVDRNGDLRALSFSNAKGVMQDVGKKPPSWL